MVGGFSRLALAIRAAETLKATWSELSAEPAESDDVGLGEVNAGDELAGGVVDKLGGVAERLASSGSVLEEIL